MYLDFKSLKKKQKTKNTFLTKSTTQISEFYNVECKFENLIKIEKNSNFFLYYQFKTSQIH